MDIVQYKEEVRPTDTLEELAGYLSDALSRHKFGLSVTTSALRSYLYGNRIPQLQMAIALRDVTGGALDLESWPGLKKRYGASSLRAIITKRKHA